MFKRKKQSSNDQDDEADLPSSRKGRASGRETMLCLRERAEIDASVRKQEIERRNKEQKEQREQQNQMLMLLQNQRMAMQQQLQSKTIRCYNNSSNQTNL